MISLKKTISWKTVGYTLFGLSIFFLLISLFLPFPKASIKINTFSDYLGLIAGLAGSIVTITVFLIQNSTQDYSSQLVRMTFFKNRYFALILTYISFALIFFIYGVTFDISPRAEFIGFFIGVGLIFNFISLLVISSYYMNLTNVIKEIENRSINYIRFAKVKTLPIIGNIGFAKYSSKGLIDHIVPIFDTLKKSVSLNQNDISSQCLRSLDNIVKFYLENTKDFNAVEDDILSRIGDEISFLIDDCIKYENQKFLEKIAIFLGNLGEYALTYRKPLANINNHATMFSRLLVTLFIKSYRFSRTSAPMKAIEEISRLVRICVQRELSGSALTYNYDLEEIVTLCLKKPSPWSATLIAFTINKSKFLIDDCTLAAIQKKGVRVDLFDGFFRMFFKTIKEASKSFRGINYDVVIRSVFNLHSVLTIAAKKHPDLPIYKEIPNWVFVSLVDNYSNLCNKILQDSKIDIDFMFLSFLPEFAFFTQYFNENNIPLDEKHEELLKNILDRTIIDFDNPSSHLFHEYYKSVEDYFSILIFSKNLKLCKKQVVNLINFYDQVKRTRPTDSRTNLCVYGLLKTIGAFMDGDKDFSDIQNIITRAISPDFKEYKQIGTAGPSFFEMYDYPDFKKSYDHWYINPLSIWTMPWQDKINNYFIQEKFVKYHEKLKAHTN